MYLAVVGGTLRYNDISFLKVFIRLLLFFVCMFGNSCMLFA
jgi:hypothetical protein